MDIDWGSGGGLTRDLKIYYAVVLRRIYFFVFVRRLSVLLGHLLLLFVLSERCLFV